MNTNTGWMCWIWTTWNSV